MTSFREQFEQEQEEQPLLGDVPIFEELIANSDRGREEIEQLWNTVEPEGYYKSEKAELLEDMYLRSKGY